MKIRNLYRTLIMSVAILSVSVAAVVPPKYDNRRGFVMPQPQDTIPKLKYKFSGLTGNPLIDFRYNSPLFLPPPNVGRHVEYDPISNSYTIISKIGNITVGTPMIISPQEYNTLNSNLNFREYLKETRQMENPRINGENSFLNKYLNPKLNVNIEGFDKIFGTNSIDIKPQGTATVRFGIKINRTENPLQSIRQQRNVLFDFDESIKMGVTGQVGDKMKLGLNYNTDASFEFENQTTIEYTGHDDEIIQKIEAGNVSLPLRGTLIQGSSTLFGIKTQLKFGNLTVTSIASQQKGESKVIEVEGGSVMNDFEISAGDYEANKHFFLSHYFKENYDKALAHLPVVNSGITITKIEVWVTNKTSQVENTRNIVAFTDLAEDIKDVYNRDFVSANPSAVALPYNNRNNLYEQLITSYAGIRDINLTSNILSGILDPGVDYEKIENARKLDPSEYTLNAKLGYISLNTVLDDDDVLAVAYEYTVNGKTYKVGEFSSGDVNAPQALVVKLLRSTINSPDLPLWDLMMKNIYSIGAYQISADNFQLKVLYQNDETGTKIDYIPEGKINGRQLLSVMNLDNTNTQLDPYPDGVFDFIDGITVIPKYGRIIFPVREPFGEYLEKKIGDKNIAQKYVFKELYDSTQTKAKQIAEKNKFYISGQYKSSSGSVINLNAMNIPQGSVKVTCGGAQLQENVDYRVDYFTGQVTILNESYLMSGSPIKVSLESNTLYNMQEKTFIGTHLDYKISKDISIGSTILRLSERPMTYKLGIGYEPISNTIWGFDLSMQKEVPFLTKMVDLIPFVETKEKSTVSITGEFAKLVPGHSKILEKSGVSYIDDFEATVTDIDLKSPQMWVLSSVPQGQSRFPEASRADSVISGFNRAKLAWYYINPDLLRSNSATPPHITKEDQSNHLVREVYETEIFPNRESITGFPPIIPVLNLAYYPKEKGPYNYDTEGVPGISAGIDSKGQLNNPKTRWGGIMRQMPITDFEEANVEYIEFWIMDPFVYDTLHTGGELYINLGNISEDILKDSRKSFENGIPYPYDPTKLDTTQWGLVPRVQFVNNAFDNNPDARRYQDVGLDCISDNDERNFFRNYLNKIAELFGTNSIAYQNAYDDPSNDDYHFFRGTDYDEQQVSILDRYKKYNGLEGNSATPEQTTESYSTTKDLYPDMEDINLDRTLSETESYYQYKIVLRPDMMQIGKNHITNIINAKVKLRNDETARVKWYQIKIPVYVPDSVVGKISDFKSIRFMRMYLTGFEKDIVLRFAKLNLIRSEFRKYNFALTEAGEVETNDATDNTEFEISAVNIEENSTKQPVNYVLPPGVTREIDPQNTQIRQLNEQAMVLKVSDLPDGEARAAYKNVYMDLRQYQRLKMFVHAEAVSGKFLADNDLCLFIRMGSDYKENYYEYEIPLKLTQQGFYNNNLETDREIVWPIENNIDIAFEELQQVKQIRNDRIRKDPENFHINAPFYVYVDNKKITVRGNPNLSNIKSIMIGVRNRSKTHNPLPDDGLPKSAEIWVNELRLTDFKENGGWAANLNINAQLADFADITLSAYTHTPGFGSIEKKVNDRYKETVYQYDFTSLVELGKFFPQKYGVKIPFYFGYYENYSLPQYNPLDPDIEMKTALTNPELSADERKELYYNTIEYQRRKSINFSNISISGLKGQSGGRRGRSRAVPFYHISNINASFSYNEIYSRNINLKYQFDRRVTANLNYNYSTRPKNVRPFAKWRFLNNPAFQLIKDFNFYYMPSMVAIKAEITRNYRGLQNRNIASDAYIPPIFQKEFHWRRNYDLRYNLSRGIKFEFSAQNQARVNPQGWIDRNDNYFAGDTLFMNLLDLGTNTDYQQKSKLTWAVPLKKIPLFSWTDLSIIYNSEYYWKKNLEPVTVEATDTTPEYTINYGNQISNAQTIQIDGLLNFQSLYSKIPYLKSVNNRFTKTGRKPTKKRTKKVKFEKTGIRLKKGRFKSITHNLKTENVSYKITDEKGQEISGELVVVNQNKIKFKPERDAKKAHIIITGEREISENILTVITDYILYSAMAVRTINISYGETNGTYIPGYNLSTDILGMRKINGLYAPGFPFIFGWQDPNFYKFAAENGWLVRDSLLNDAIVMTHQPKLNVRATLKPINNMDITLTADRSLWQKTTDYYLYSASDGFQSRSKIISGANTGNNFQISFNTVKTAFVKLDRKTYKSQTFDNFLSYRTIIAERLRQQRTGINGYTGSYYTDSAGVRYPDGYGSLSQEVLIPAFLAAYSGTSPYKIGLSAFPSIPIPDWNIEWTGLSNLPIIKNFIKTIKITSNYQSDYYVVNFANNPNYDFDEFDKFGYSFARYETNAMFIPQYEITQVTIDERFVPLIGVDISWEGTLSTKIEFRKKRLLSLTLSDNKLTERNSSEILFGLGYKYADFPLNIVVGGSKRKIKSDLNIRADVGINDDVVVIRMIDQNISQASEGIKKITVRATADYAINDRLQIKLFYNHNINDPIVTQSFRTSNINFGFEINFSLVQ